MNDELLTLSSKEEKSIRRNAEVRLTTVQVVVGGAQQQTRSSDQRVDGGGVHVRTPHDHRDSLAA